MAKPALISKLPKPSDAGAAVKRGAAKAADTVKNTPPPSPNPMTNLLIADLVLRGGGRLLRQLVETNVLKTKYSPDKARKIVKGRGLAQTLISTAVARVATRSVPGAILVGGGLLAKALYDRSRGAEAKAEGEQAVERQAAKAEPPAK
jgi:hypothetical protein